MPADVAAELKRLGGFWGALLTVLPALGDVARVTRRSTSSGLSRSDTGEGAGSDGIHVYVAVQDGADSERFLRALHDRCWLAGLGWMMVSASGALLERSIVDRMVGGAGAPGVRGRAGAGAAAEAGQGEPAPRRRRWRRARHGGGVPAADDRRDRQA